IGEVAGESVILDIKRLAECVIGLEQEAAGEVVLHLNGCAVVRRIGVGAEVIHPQKIWVQAIWIIRIGAGRKAVWVLRESDAVTFIADVAQLQYPLSGEFVLQGQIPLFHIRAFQRRRNEKRRKAAKAERPSRVQRRGEVGIGRGLGRDDIGNGIGDRRVTDAERRCSDGKSREGWAEARRLGYDVAVQTVVVDGKARTHGKFAVAERVPSQSDRGREILPIWLIELFESTKPGVHELLVKCAARTQYDSALFSVGLGEHSEVLVAQTKIEGQIVAEFPVILDKPSKVATAKVPKPVWTAQDVLPGRGVDLQLLKIRTVGNKIRQAEKLIVAASHGIQLSDLSVMVVFESELEAMTSRTSDNSVSEVENIVGKV